MMRKFQRFVALCGFILVGAGQLAAQGNEESLTVVLVRHAERAAEPAGDPILTDAGTARVETLVAMLSGANVTAAYSTQFQRTRLTAGPVAEAHGITLQIAEAARGVDHVADVVGRIRSHQRGEVVVVAGHSNTIPAIVNSLAGTEMENLTEFEYDRLYIVTLTDPAGTGSLVTLRFGAASN
jgi:broad specificity phosphatase PhoE